MLAVFMYGRFQVRVLTPLLSVGDSPTLNNSSLKEIKNEERRTGSTRDVKGAGG